MKTNKLIHSVIFTVALSGAAMADEQPTAPQSHVTEHAAQAIVAPVISTDLEQLINGIKQELLFNINQQVSTTLNSLATTVKQVIQE